VKSHLFLIPSHFNSSNNNRQAIFKNFNLKLLENGEHHIILSLVQAYRGSAKKALIQIKINIYKKIGQVIQKLVYLFD
jgi:hypothetical protein